MPKQEKYLEGVQRTRKSDGSGKPRKAQCVNCLSTITPDNPARMGGAMCAWCQGEGDYED